MPKQGQHAMHMTGPTTLRFSSHPYLGLSTQLYLPQLSQRAASA